MPAAEAEEALENAEVFAKASANAAKRGRENLINAALQENVDWFETITREIVEFAKAVADFKRRN
ncbi:MAG TPA: hypothetical protein VJK54_07695, partial [Chthoniobacterales bacterium]|nr:hypothetical protein [Chthoniobacterales bacterium]